MGELHHFFGEKNYLIYVVIRPLLKMLSDRLFSGFWNIIFKKFFRRHY